MMKKIFIFLFAILSTIGVYSQSAPVEELPAISAANAADFFIPATAIHKYNLEAAKGDAWMKVYNNMADDAKLQRVNDIRWEAKSKEEALNWFNENIGMISENGTDITGKLTAPAATDIWKVYEANENMKTLMKSLGMEQNQYTFAFVTGKYVVKIFIGTSPSVSLTEACTFAKEGLKAVLKASGNPKMAELVL